MIFSASKETALVHYKSTLNPIINENSEFRLQIRDAGFTVPTLVSTIAPNG